MKFLLVLVGFISFNVTAFQSPEIKKIFFIIGPPGSGKTSAADAIKNKYNDQIAHYSAGNLLREEAKKDTERGRLIKSLISQAQIVPLEIGMDVIGRAVLETSKPIILLDGFPPTFEYATAFQDFVKQNPNIQLIGAIEIFVSMAVAAKRVLQRNRTDDEQSIFEMRYSRYIKNSEILNTWYKEFYKFNSIDGSQNLDKTTESIEECILSDISFLSIM